MSSQPEDLNILQLMFQGRLEVISVLNTGGSIVKYLSATDPVNFVCPLMGTEITLGETLGKGRYGEVFKISFQGGGQREYAAKRLPKPDVIKFVPNSRRTITYEDLQDTYGIHVNQLNEYNNTRARPEDEIKQIVYVPLFRKSCLTRKQARYNRFDFAPGSATVNVNDTLCNPPYPEYVIGILVSELLRRGDTINVLDILYFATCEKDKADVKQYIFMERTRTTLRKAIMTAEDQIPVVGSPGDTINPSTIGSIIIQTLHAIACYQNKYKIVHGDLHDDNVLLLYPEEDDVVWNDPNGDSIPLNSIDYYQYDITVDGETTSLYVPKAPVVKIADWGLACKYSPPQVLQRTTFETGYAYMTNYSPTKIHTVPNFFTPAYDTMLFINSINVMIAHHSKMEIPRLLNDVLDVILNVPGDSTLEVFSKAYNKAFDPTTNRPRIDQLVKSYSHVDPIDILRNKELMEPYLVKPEGKVALLMGKLTKV